MTQTPASPAGASPASASPASAQTVIVWVTEDTWRGCVDAARDLAPPRASFILLHVAPDDVPEAAHAAYAGLLGRGRPERDPGTRVEDLAATAAGRLLEAAARRLDRPCTRTERRGRVEREVITAADGAALLVLARDGDRSRLGPKSLGRAGRFVVDHAPCPVLLVWPEEAPGPTPHPPPPPGGHPPPPPPRARPRPGPRGAPAGQERAFE